MWSRQKKTRVFFTGIFDNGESAQGQKDVVMHCAEICYLFRTQKPVSPGNTSCAHFSETGRCAELFLHWCSDSKREKGGWMRITLICLVVDSSKNEAVLLYTAQSTICYRIFKRFYRLDFASSPKIHRVQRFIYRVDGDFFSVSALCKVCWKVHTYVAYRHWFCVLHTCACCVDVSARVWLLYTDCR